MSLGMLILLAMTFFQQLTMKMVPLQDFPLVSQYFCVTTIEIGIALLITTLTLNFYYHSHSKMPGFMKLIILDFLGKVTRIRPPPEDKRQKKTKRSFMFSERKFQLSSCSREINPNPDSQFDIELTEIAPTRNDITETDLNDSTVGLVSFKSMDENSSNSSSVGVTRENVDTLDNIEQDGIVEGPSDWNKDWVLASRIIDCFSMYAAVLIGILTVLIVFLRAPRFWTSRTGLNG